MDAEQDVSEKKYPVNVCADFEAGRRVSTPIISIAPTASILYFVARVTQALDNVYDFDYCEIQPRVPLDLKKPVPTSQIRERRLIHSRKVKRVFDRNDYNNWLHNPDAAPTVGKLFPNKQYLSARDESVDQAQATGLELYMYFKTDKTFEEVMKLERMRKTQTTPYNLRVKRLKKTNNT